MSTVDSTSDQRTVNNTMRHAYRVLSDKEKAAMQAIKDKGAELFALIEGLRTAPNFEDAEDALHHKLVVEAMLNTAGQRVEESVMWAVKHITA